MRPTNGRAWELVKELDTYCKDNDVTDWELDFIASCMERVEQKRSYTPGQIDHILRLNEKYLC